MRRALILIVSLLFGAAVACSSTTPTTSVGAGTNVATTVPAGAPGSTPGTTPATPSVVKDILAQQVDPPGAPGRTLTLIRYTIDAGAKLAPHVHPGIQMAYIDAGTLTYTVESGTATIKRAGGQPEPVTGPTTITLNRGDSVIETDGMVHFGANQGADPLIITATLLTEDGKDLAVPVNSTTPGTTTP